MLHFPLIILLSVLAIVELRMEYNVEKLRFENKKLMLQVRNIEEDEKTNLKLTKVVASHLKNSIPVSKVPNSQK